MTAMTYKGVGVDYDAMDPFKILAQRRATLTAHNSDRLGVLAIEASRGESAYMFGLQHGGFLGHVEEGLGTKNLVADALRVLDPDGPTYYDQLAQDTVAMIVNDLITLGLLPATCAMHLAVGSSDWFDDALRANDLVNGWGNACDLARCIWSGGETPTLKDVIIPGASLLSGSAVGIAKDQNKVLGTEAILPGDAIVLVESSGVHANGLTLARRIAAKLPDGYLTKLQGGRTYGETLLDPTHIYVGLVEDCLDAGVELHYAVNITGHGWRKLMRAPQSLAYIVNVLPTRQPIFDFLQEHGPVDDVEAYGNWNMGAGFALYVPDSAVPKVIEVANHLNLRAFHAGYIAESDVKKVMIAPMRLTFAATSLAVR